MSYVSKFNQQLRVILDNPADRNIKSTIEKVINANHECSLLAFGKCNTCNSYLAMRYGNITVVDDINVEFDYTREIKSCENVATTVAASIAVSKPTTPSRESILDISVKDISSGISVSIDLPVTSEGYVKTLTPHECAPCQLEHFPANCTKPHVLDQKPVECKRAHLSEHTCPPCAKKHMDNHKCPPCKLEHLSSHKCPPCNQQHLDKHKCPACTRAHLDSHTCKTTVCNKEHLSEHQCPNNSDMISNLQSQLTGCRNVIHEYFYKGNPPSQAVLSDILSTHASTTPTQSRRELPDPSDASESESTSDEEDKPSKVQSLTQKLGSTSIDELDLLTKHQGPPKKMDHQLSTRKDNEDKSPQPSFRSHRPRTHHNTQSRAPSPTKSVISNASTNRQSKPNPGLIQSLLQTDPRPKTRHSTRHQADEQSGNESKSERKRHRR